MSDSHHITDIRGTSVVSDMDAGTVLNIGTITDGDGCHIAAHDSIEPDTALVTHRDVTDDGRILAEITVFSPFGCQTAVTLD